MAEAMLLLALAGGALVGFSLSLVGGGGSILAVPILVYLVGIKDPHLAIGTSAVGVAANALIGLVGKAKLKYTMYLGGNVSGTRLAFLYKDMVPLEQIGETLAPLFAAFKDQRSNGESFGDFCQRQGVEGLRSLAEPLAAAS